MSSFAGNQEADYLFEHLHHLFRVSAICCSKRCKIVVFAIITVHLFAWMK